MAKPKNVTINLTPKQREALRALTGDDHAAVVFEGSKKALRAKLAPRAAAVSTARAMDFAGVPAVKRIGSRKATRPGIMAATPLDKLNT